MVTNDSCQRGNGATSTRRQSRAPYTEGVAKATIKYREEQANKPPSARTIKAKEKKAKIKERKESDEYQTRKAAWEEQKATSNAIEAVKRTKAYKRIKANRRKNRKFQETREMESDFD